MEKLNTKLRDIQRFAKNPWHHVGYGNDAPQCVNAII